MSENEELLAGGSVEENRGFYQSIRAIDIVGYSPPMLRVNKTGWYVDYYVVNPHTRQKVRMRIKLNRIRGRNERYEYARKLIAQLTLKLQGGWTPWTKADHSLSTLQEVLDRWDRMKERHGRHSSPYTYTSMTAIVRGWLRDQGFLHRYTKELTKTMVGKFLDYISEERQVGNRTYNNYLVFLGMLFKWMFEQGYLDSSPLEGFSKRKAGQKSRTYLSEEERREMVSWIRQHDPDFLIPCLFIYGTLIRPGELRRLKVGHVDLDRQIVFLPAEETKSGTERTPAIPNWMRDVLLEHGFDKHLKKCWIVGKRLTPGDTPIARNRLNRHWVAMRKELGWDDRRQLYSLRDTGIIQLLRDGVDLLHVMQQAGHTEIGTTNKYLKHAFPNGPAEVKAKATPLFSASPIAR